MEARRINYLRDRWKQSNEVKRWKGGKVERWKGGKVEVETDLSGSNMEWKGGSVRWSRWKIIDMTPRGM